jgi:two-component system alkaline phosphatase synthesis response regulator PhoP
MDSNYRILLVEDEEKINKVVKLNLEMEGYEVVSCNTGDSGLKCAQGQRFDLLLLDIMLPKISGIQICESVRLKNKEIPIIFISAKDSPADRIKGLKVGADDYLVKPFSLEELQLRVNNHIKRSKPEEKEAIHNYAFSGNTIDFKSFKASGKKGNISLTQKEALLLRLLIDRSNEVLSRKQILQAVWGYDVFPATRTIDNFILSFRKNFEPDPKNPIHFLSIRGVGYKFVPPA